MVHDDRMNIAFYDPNDLDYDAASPYERPFGGSESALCYLSAELARLGHRVWLLTGTRNPRNVSGVECVRHRSMPREFFAQPLDAFVMLNGPADLGANLRSLLHHSTPLVLWTQHAPNERAVQSLHTGEVRRTWDRIVCVSSWHRQATMDTFGLEPTKVSILRNAIAPAFASMFISRDELIAAKKGAPILAYTSTPYRGLNVLLSVFSAIKNEVPGVRLRVYSDMKLYYLGEDADREFMPLYERCRSTPGIEYIGTVPQPQLAAALREATILAYPCTFPETSCIAVMEALAAGLLVVTSDLGALAETSMGMGRLVPPIKGDAGLREFVAEYYESLSQVLAERARDPDQFAAARFDQVRAVNETCTWSARAREWERTIPTFRRVPDNQ
jgi:glycosyltransferase involved in cell wall biosynthesis